VSRIRIGGKTRKPALSLSGPLPQITATAAELIDWDASLAIAGFDQDEAEFVLSTRLEGRTCVETAAELGWSARKAKAVQRRVLRKMAFGPVAPHEKPQMRRASGIAFRLHLSPGHSVWDMTPPNPVEPAILQLERTIFFVESST
jgi:hypothetical protein